MRVEIDLTRTSMLGHVAAGYQPHTESWLVELWPNKRDGSECIAIWADRLDQIADLGQAILTASMVPIPPFVPDDE